MLHSCPLVDLQRIRYIVLVICHIVSRSSFPFLSYLSGEQLSHLPSVVNLGIKSWLGLKSPHWPDVLAPLVVAFVLYLLPNLGTLSYLLNSLSVLMLGVNASIGLTSSSCNSLLIPVPHYYCVQVPQHLSQTLSHNFFSFWCLNLFELLVKIFFF